MAGKVLKFVQQNNIDKCELLRAAPSLASQILRNLRANLSIVTDPNANKLLNTETA